MPYVQRTTDGQIIGLYALPQPQPDGTDLAPEWLEEDHAEVVAFLHPLSRIRAQAEAALLEAVSAARRKYAPDAAHQGLIYDVKAQEADAYVAAGRPEDTSAWIVLTRSAEANGVSVSDHADAVRARRTAWLVIAAETEALREMGANAIRAAETAEAIEQARVTYVAQLAAL